MNVRWHPDNENLKQVFEQRMNSFFLLETAAIKW